MYQRLLLFLGIDVTHVSKLTCEINPNQFIWFYNHFRSKIMRRGAIEYTDTVLY